jgi:hypothetical protein
LGNADEDIYWKAVDRQLKDLKIIGNIYENPELIKQQDRGRHEWRPFSFATLKMELENNPTTPLLLEGRGCVMNAAIFKTGGYPQAPELRRALFVQSSPKRDYG